MRNNVLRDFVIKEALRHGVWAEVGRGRLKRIDLVFWGCIRVLVKEAKLLSGGSYSFRFYDFQINPFLADFVIVFHWNDLYILEANNKIFYNKSGDLLKKIRWNPPRHFNEKNAWQMIEKFRLQRSIEIEVAVVNREMLFPTT
jgi:hypothetical protein